MRLCAQIGQGKSSMCPCSQATTNRRGIIRHHFFSGSSAQVGHFFPPVFFLSPLSAKRELSVLSHRGAFTSFQAARFMVRQRGQKCQSGKRTKGSGAPFWPSRGAGGGARKYST